ncbi:nuclear transport factor 2 family protein [Catenulispora sp. NL8]|uniref:Nuclear transport factor 2 family protein n=1 Tax=Catenulispora pinistramenti TaxID=2705254 RepID=A0ABS5KK27_9ACTN|nr:nuclear transport factor 2 family protein [Catenulispora pinistramenti]MBS2546410.1 nuclear transport factor 2 family protein [Catenulispora pinistramenti]
MGGGRRVSAVGIAQFAAERPLDKQVVVDYYTTAFAANPEKAIAVHFGPGYVQYNPDAQDGPEAFIGLVKWLRGEYPRLRLDIKRVVAEGDMVPTHSDLDVEPGNPDNPGRALADSSAWRMARSSSTGR